MSRRNAAITWFVIVWTLIFQYETLRANYLSPLFKRHLPKLALLFPPAGWIMFYHVDQSYGVAEVYGMRSGQPFLIDPHQIFQTKAVGYDNIRRNVLVSVLSPSFVGSAEQCTALSRSNQHEYWIAVLQGICGHPSDQAVETLPFCRYLRRKFPDYDAFAVVYAHYPDLIASPDRVVHQVAYRCDEGPEGRK